MLDIVNELQSLALSFLIPFLTLLNLLFRQIHKELERSDNSVTKE